jgi:2-polyprenyl-3-methyl-5-hydroxy-6-metoxy-1,4-benzoquinol methylase
MKDNNSDMSNQNHWEHIYQTKAVDAVSWYRPHLEKSLALIRLSAPNLSAAIIDVGGGESTLVDDLLADGYHDITVLDISSKAIETARKRLGRNAGRVIWLTANINEVDLPEHRYDVWHDRAVFHFLTEPWQRTAYVRQVARSVKPGGHVIVATFGPKGPQKCSGLDVMRYDADALHDEFGAGFQLVESVTELHETPFGTTQQFVYCLCKMR